MDGGIRLPGLGGESYRVIPCIGQFYNNNLCRTGSGFKLNVQGLTSLSLNLGNHTTQPLVSVGVSLNYGEFITVNLTEGRNDIPLSTLGPTSDAKAQGNTVVRINSWGWQNNRVNLESLELNEVC